MCGGHSGSVIQWHVWALGWIGWATQCSSAVDDRLGNLSQPMQFCGTSGTPAVQDCGDQRLHGIGRHSLGSSVVIMIVAIGVVCSVLGRLGGYRGRHQSSRSRKNAVRRSARRPRGGGRRRIDQGISWMGFGYGGIILGLVAIATACEFIAMYGDIVSAGWASGCMPWGTRDCGDSGGAEWASAGLSEAIALPSNRGMVTAIGAPSDGGIIGRREQEGDALVRSCVTLATWWAASADRPLVKAQENRSWPMLGPRSIGGALSISFSLVARLALVVSAGCTKEERRPGERPPMAWPSTCIGGLVASTFPAAAVGGWPSGATSDQQYASFGVPAHGSIVAARWVAKARRMWPRGGRGLLIDVSRWTVVAVVVDGTWSGSVEEIGRLVSTGDGDDPHAAPQALTSGSAVTWLLDPAGRSTARPGCGQGHCHSVTFDHRGVADTIHQRRCDDRYDYQMNRAWTGRGPPFPVPPPPRSCRPSSSTSLTWTSALCRPTIWREGAEWKRE